jgi:hypothetical protein
MPHELNEDRRHKIA